MNTTVQVAETILEQLGGHRFIAMTGAKNFIALPNALGFRIPRTNGISQVKITLTASDDHTVEFIGKRGDQLVVVRQYEGIYCDQLQDIFTAATGLRTRLF